MGVIGNTIGGARYVDLPITAGTDPTVSFTTDRVLDLIGIEILAPGAASAALKVDTVAVAGGAVAAFTGNEGAVHAGAPSSGVPLFTGTEGAVQANQTQGDGFYANWQSSGTAQSGITDRTGSVPAPGSVTPISAAIAANKVVEVDITGTVTTVADLPAADGDGFITLPVGTTQDGASYVAGQDNLPFRVKASDTLEDTFAGVVRLVFGVPVSDPNTAAKGAGTYPNNGVQKGSAY